MGDAGFYILLAVTHGPSALHAEISFESDGSNALPELVSHLIDELDERPGN